MRASAVGLSPSPTRVTMLRSQSRSGYYWPTPNGGKISIVLEECGLPYDLRTVDRRGEQFEPSFLAISPNNRRPAIIDPDGPDGAPISVSSPARSCNISRARAAVSAGMMIAYERGQSPVRRHEQASGEPRGVRRLGLGLEAHGSSTFPVGERPTSPRTKRRAKFCSAQRAR